MTTDTSSKPDPFYEGTATWEDCVRAMMRFEAYMRGPRKRWNSRVLEFFVERHGENTGLVCRPYKWKPKDIVAICIPFGRDASTPSITLAPP